MQKPDTIYKGKIWTELEDVDKYYIIKELKETIRKRNLMIKQLREQLVEARKTEKYKDDLLQTFLAEDVENVQRWNTFLHSYKEAENKNDVKKH